MILIYIKQIDEKSIIYIPSICFSLLMECLKNGVYRSTSVGGITNISCFIYFFIRDRLSDDLLRLV